MKRDYRALLKKYIEHVVDCEGTDFIHACYKYNNWKDDEWEILEEIQRELREIE